MPAGKHQGCLVCLLLPWSEGYRQYPEAYLMPLGLNSNAPSQDAVSDLPVWICGHSPQHHLPSLRDYFFPKHLSTKLLYILLVYFSYHVFFQTLRPCLFNCRVITVPRMLPGISICVIKWKDGKYEYLKYPHWVQRSRLPLRNTIQAKHKILDN